MNYRNNNVLFKVVISCLLVSAQGSLIKRDVNGTPTGTEEKTFLVEIGSRGILNYVGSLLSEFYVLTAANVVYGIEPADLIVMAAASRPTGPFKIYNVSNYITHPDYMKWTYDVDVAVLRLATPMTDIPTVPLSQQPLRPGDILQVVLYEVQKLNPWLTSAIEVVGIETCLNNYAFSNIETPTMFCGRYTNEKECKSFPGSPIIRNGEIAGIVVYDLGCTPQYNYTTVFTDVAAVNDFIKTATLALDIFNIFIN